MSSLLHDIRHAFRSLRGSRGVATVVVLTMALGIGASTLIFSVADAVLWRPLPYPEPDRIALLQETNLQTGGRPFHVSYPNFRDWREASQSFESMALCTSGGGVATGLGDPMRVGEALVSSEIFSLFRTSAEIGRTMLREDDRPGAPKVVVVSHAFWVKHLASDPAALGRSFEIDGDAFTVVGVMPASFAFPSSEVEVWVPMGPFAKLLDNRAVHRLSALGRLRPGVTFDAARAEIASIAAAIQAKDPAADPRHGATVTPYRESLVDDYRPALVILLGAVGCVVLIGCTNAAHLLLARAVARGRDAAIRSALGASRARIVRQAIVEGALVGLAGGALGLLLAQWGLALLSSGQLDFLPLARGATIDARVVAFCIATSLAAGLLAAIAPAVKLGRLDIHGALKNQAGVPSRRAAIDPRRGLVALEVALSIVLLVGAGLMIRSLARVLAVDPGFRPERVLTMAVSLPSTTFADRPAIVAWYRDLPERLATVPQIESVSAVNALPISGGDAQGNVTIEGRAFVAGEVPSASFRRILPGYFPTMAIPIVEGRDFDAHDTGAGDDKVVIVNEGMARRFFPRGKAVGSRIKIGPPEREPWLKIVGVVADVKNVGLDAGTALATYEPHAQRPWSDMSVIVRTKGDPARVAEAVRARIREGHTDILADQVDTMEGRIAASVAGRRLNMALLAAFAGLALALAAVGVYAVMAFSVSRRTREMGIRMALGARRLDVVRLVIAEAAGPAVAGIGAGLAAAAALTRLLSSLLFDVSPLDATTFFAAPLVLAAVALLASYLPARRAAGTDPLIALRSE
ncbi:MAG: ABC transporter permease [Acidobacteria bacterium]|nr:ABC transporter permease [Acidobacteriota bacterium]